MTGHCIGLGKGERREQKKAGFDYLLEGNGWREDIELDSSPSFVNYGYFSRKRGFEKD